MNILQNLQEKRDFKKLSISHIVHNLVIFRDNNNFLNVFFNFQAYLL